MVWDRSYGRCRLMPFITPFITGIGVCMLCPHTLQGADKRRCLLRASAEMTHQICYGRRRINVVSSHIAECTMCDEQRCVYANEVTTNRGTICYVEYVNASQRARCVTSICVCMFLRSHIAGGRGYELLGGICGHYTQSHRKGHAWLRAWNMW